jgi:hypothetical protein
MRTIGRKSAALLVATGLWAAACNSSQTGTGEEDLVGGTPAGKSDFPSTVHIKNGCTAAKVGPRHLLTAAHCVHDAETNALREHYHDGASIQITGKKTVSKLGWAWLDGYVTLTIENTAVPDAWFYGGFEAQADPQLEAQGASPVVVLEPEAPPDVAVIVLTPDAEAALASIPTATVGLDTIAVGSAVTIMGYGCETGVDGAPNLPDIFRSRLKFHTTTTLGIESLVHEGSYVDDAESSYATNLEASYLFTPGRAMDPGEASLCPGDSGGPVYLDDGTQSVIVGINAYYSFLPRDEDPDRISMTNWHTRLDGTSRFAIGAWLGDLGVNTKLSYQPCANKSCGEECSWCAAPDDASCVDNTLLKLCNAQGLCEGAVPVCDG